MSQKLLRKTSNRFLQLSLPENLIANKHIGKREKYRIKKPSNHSRMENSLCRQWVFSWNIYKKRMQEKVNPTSASTLLTPSGERVENTRAEPGKNIIELNALTTWAALSEFPPRSLVAPVFHLLTHKINRAVGGNIIQHLNQYIRGYSPVLPSWNGHPGEKASAGEMGTSRAPYRLGCSSPGDFLAEQIRLNYFRIIYSLDEKGKASARRDKINDDYRNQLAECRKIAFLYGDLPRKTIVRALRRARGLAGDVDSNFLSLLERRLDAALKRAFFFSTIKAARQWIERGKILVNNQQVTLSGYLLQPADLIRINPAAEAEWRKQCLRTATASTPPRKAPGHSNVLNIQKNRFTPDRSRQKGGEEFFLNFPGRFPTPSGGKAGGFIQGVDGKNRRFPFSPALMRKWKRWSELWSNTQQPLTPSQEGGHRWNLLLPIYSSSLHNTNSMDFYQKFLDFYSSSTFASYLFAITLLQGRKKSQDIGKTPFSMDRAAPSASSPQDSERKVGERGSPHFSLLFRRETPVTPLVNAGGMGYGRAHTALSPRNPRESFSPWNFFGQLRQGKEKKKECQWLHQQQSYVVDGLYPLRWNKAFATKKSPLEKLHRWRWSCVKPLHLECSYKNCTVIFLYSPQKLAWPASINVSLLKKTLGR